MGCGIVSKVNAFSIEGYRANVRSSQPCTLLMLCLGSAKCRWHRNATAISPTHLQLTGGTFVTMVVHMAMATWVIAVRKRWNGGPVPGEDGAEEEVLYNGELAQYLSAVHLEHSTVHFVPGLDLHDLSVTDRV